MLFLILWGDRYQAQPLRVTGGEQVLQSLDPISGYAGMLIASHYGLRNKSDCMRYILLDYMTTQVEYILTYQEF